jgi:hypothetical protein
MSGIDDVKRSFRDTLKHDPGEMKVGLADVNESIRLIRSDMTGMERRIEDKIQAARTELLRRTEFFVADGAL